MLSGNKHVVKILLKAGAQPMRTNERGVTPLALAIAQAAPSQVVIMMLNALNAAAANP